MPAGELTAAGKIRAARFRVRAQKGRLNRLKGLSLDTRVYTRMGILKFPSSRMALEFRQLERILPVSPSIGRRIRALRATSTDRSDWCWHSTARALACCRSSTQMTPDRPRLDLVQGTLDLLIGPHRSALPPSAINKPVTMACG